MLKSVFPKENELLLTYSMIDEEYLFGIKNRARENPAVAAIIALKIITQNLFHNVFTICNKSIT